jgi:hypothetical protein
MTPDANEPDSLGGAAARTVGVLNLPQGSARITDADEEVSDLQVGRSFT